jgi:urea carboxylase-associated protein 2
MQPLYTTTLAAGCHWSLRMRRGTLMRLTDLEGGANLGMLFYNPENLLERYNAPDTLKCQHTFKLGRGHCLYSDMGRIFCSIIADDLDWHETVSGNCNATMVRERWGARDYQQDRNAWHQNGHDAFLVELAKYGLGIADMAANLNCFSKVTVSASGDMSLQTDHSQAGASLCLRFEMDSLVLMHSCPHPLNPATQYPARPVQIDLAEADPVSEDDHCRNFCAENQRGFRNNALYHLGHHPQRGPVPC